MDQHRSDSKKQQRTSEGTNPYAEAYDEAVDVHAKRDLHAWEKLLAFHERFVLQAWKDPLPARTDRIDSRRNRRFRRRA
jgi:hypothetical protein